MTQSRRHSTRWHFELFALLCSVTWRECMVTRRRRVICSCAGNDIISNLMTLVPMQCVFSLPNIFLSLRNVNVFQQTLQKIVLPWKFPSAESQRLPGEVFWYYLLPLKHTCCNISISDRVWSQQKDACIYAKPGWKAHPRLCFQVWSSNVLDMKIHFYYLL